MVTKARLNEIKRDWAAKHREYNNARAIVYVKSKPERYMVTSARRRAKMKGLEFNITHEDVHIPSHCPVLGMKLVNHIGEGRHGGLDDSPSLDKIDPTKGYIKGNIQVISSLANQMKSRATPEQLHAFADWVKENY